MGQDDPSPAFHGAKLALLNGGRVLAYQRDDRPDIPFANFWDLPGGGREGGETPARCAVRELYEEFGLRLAEDRLSYAARYEGAKRGWRDAWFFAGEITEAEIADIRFGHEGQRWTMMPVEDFLARDDAPAALQARLRAFLDQAG